MRKYILWWIPADGQGGLKMGEFPFRQAAFRHIDKARRVLLSQCSTYEDRMAIINGDFEVEVEG
jgi:hypothetical protein